VLIDVSLERELHRQAEDIEFDFRRLAITAEQIEKYKLPGKPRKDGERRALHIEETVEAEAMPAATLRGLVRNEIEALLPPDALAEAKILERAERAMLRRWAEQMEEEDED